MPDNLPVLPPLHPVSRLWLWLGLDGDTCERAFADGVIGRRLPDGRLSLDSKTLGTWSTKHGIPISKDPADIFQRMLDTRLASATAGHSAQYLAWEITRNTRDLAGQDRGRELYAAWLTRELRPKLVIGRPYAVDEVCERLKITRAEVLGIRADPRACPPVKGKPGLVGGLIDRETVDSLELCHVLYWQRVREQAAQAVPAEPVSSSA